MHKLLIAVLIISPIRNTKAVWHLCYFKMPRAGEISKNNVTLPCSSSLVEHLVPTQSQRDFIKYFATNGTTKGDRSLSICPMRRHDPVGYAVNGNKSATHHTRYKIRILLHHVNYASLKEAWDSRPTPAKSLALLSQPPPQSTCIFTRITFLWGTILGILDG